MYVSDEDDDYIIRIGEKSKDKICVGIRKDGRHLDEIKGLRLNNQKILEAIRTLLKKHVDYNNMEATSRVRYNEYQVERERIRQERETELARERDLVKRLQKDNQNKGNSSDYYSSKDFVDVRGWAGGVPNAWIVDLPNAWIVDPGRL